MAGKNVCAFSGVSIREKDTLISDLDLEIAEGEIVAMVTKDTVSSLVLQVMAGFREEEAGVVEYPVLEGETPSTGWLQYVPDDIICYYNLTVLDYFYAVSLAAPCDISEEVARLCDVFEINVDEELLDLTFEQNRLVALIQALAFKPRFLLIDRPHDMLGEKAYLQLWEEILALVKEGTTVVFTTDTFEDSIVACDRYLFYKDDFLEYDLLTEDIPVPAKLLTIEGGSLETLDMEQSEVLCRKGNTTRLLCWENDMEKLAHSIAGTGCDNFCVADLSVEEEIFEDYERWML